MDSKVQCSLCDNLKTTYLDTVKRPYDRRYFQCSNCSLIFCHPSDILPPSEEKKRYESHQNDLRTVGYETFLRKLLGPMESMISEKMLGLDYGSGPYPMMQQLAQEDGYQLEIYDPFFHPVDLEGKSYDFILCCEVAEHFRFPGQEMNNLLDLLNSNGLLGVMTSLFKYDRPFSTWHYVMDETHISIYTSGCIEWMAKNWNLTIEYRNENVTILKKI